MGRREHVQVARDLCMWNSEARETDEILNGTVTVHGVESALTAQKRGFDGRRGRIACDFGAVHVEKPLFCRVLTP